MKAHYFQFDSFVAFQHYRSEELGQIRGQLVKGLKNANPTMDFTDLVQATESRRGSA